MTPPPHDSSSSSVESHSIAFRGFQVGCIALASAFAAVATAIFIGTFVVILRPPALVASPPPIAGWDFGIGVHIESVNGKVPVGITTHPWNIPGSIIGIALGITLLVFLIRVTRPGAP